MEVYIRDLRQNGYVVIPDILNKEEIDIASSMFYNWKSTIKDHDKIHNACDPHGIYKHHEIGHQEHAWFIRTRPKVKEVFACLWGTNDLVVSFDGCCWIPKSCNKKDNFWCHSDQSPLVDEFICAQGIVSLTNNKERTLVIWQNTHLIHSQFLKIVNNKDPKANWQKIPEKYKEILNPLRRVLNVPAGSLVLWDSRVFHQNQYGSANCEERLVQYICMLPKNSEKNTVLMQKKRRDYLNKKRTTSHWPYPIKVNGLQPRNYGNPDLIINYSQLIPPNLEKYADQINELI